MAVAICSLLLVVSIAGTASAGVSPFKLLKKQVQKTSKTATKTDPTSLTSDYADIVSVSLPAGSYVLHSGVETDNNTGTAGARDDCRLVSGAAELIARATGMGGSGAGDYSSVIGLDAGIDLPGGGTIALQCRIASTSAASAAQSAYHANIVATKVATLTSTGS